MSSICSFLMIFAYFVILDNKNADCVNLIVDYPFIYGRDRIA